MLKSVILGDRVAWKANPKTEGTIRGFVFGDHPYYIVWDKGTDDWYKAEDLMLLDKPKLNKHPCG